MPAQNRFYCFEIKGHYFFLSEGNKLAGLNRTPRSRCHGNLTGARAAVGCSSPGRQDGQTYLSAALACVILG
jgi:hypothetical protein